MRKRDERLEKWMNNLLDVALKKAGGRYQLADEIQVTNSAINKWTSGDGSLPNLHTTKKLLEYVGGDIQRALPDWEPDAEETEFTVLGRVSAGIPKFFENDPVVVHVPKNEWQPSKYWPHTMGDVCYFEVSGDSMEPDFSDGDYLAVRAPRPGQSLPDNTPCIIKTSPYEMTLKFPTSRS